MDIKEFKINFSQLDEPRPNGVSGLMRVKNDSQFIEASVRSVIDCLDELIICYQESMDDTIEIVHKLESEFPDKIKSYFYRPMVISHNLSTEQWKKCENNEIDSVNLLSNYYNYTLSKSTFKYAVKIDADQIYFTDKFMEICNLYRSNEKTRIKKLDALSYFYLKIIIKAFQYAPIVFSNNLILNIIPPPIVNSIRRFITGKVKNDKVITSFEGLNIYKYDKSLFICGGSFSDGCQPPIGGCGDHIFFPVSSNNVYQPLLDKKNNRIIEVMNTSQKVFFGLGFLWFHLNAMRRHIYPKNKNQYKNKLLSFSSFKKTKRYKKFRLPLFISPIVMMDYNADYNLIKRELSNNSNLQKVFDLIG